MLINVKEIQANVTIEINNRMNIHNTIRSDNDLLIYVIIKA